MLWLALLLPALPLQLAGRALPSGLPLAIVEGPPQRPLVVHCNDAARRQGVAEGMKLAAAQALVRDLIAVERHVEREREALAELAAWAYQFSGTIVVQPDGVLLETGASERLFGGRARLSRAVRDGLEPLGYRGTFGYAVTPRAARVVALARERRLDCPHLFDGARLESALARLPFTLLEWDGAVEDTCARSGWRRSVTCSRCRARRSRSGSDASASTTSTVCSRAGPIRSRCTRRPNASRRRSNCRPT
jgi:protein ImuB